jgi:adenosylcobyric acid synthase
VRYPTSSNLDEFKSLEQVADVRWIGSPEEVDACELVVLPGSKAVAADLDWLRRSGVAAALVPRARAGKPVLGICGGLQLLGKRISDPDGVDGSRDGLGLLDVETVFRAVKRTGRGEVVFGELDGPFSGLSGLRVEAYEIRHGETTPLSDCCVAAEHKAFASGSVLGVTAHGLLADPEVISALMGSRPTRELEDVFDGLADLVEERLDVPALGRLVGVEL